MIKIKLYAFITILLLYAIKTVNPVFAETIRVNGSGSPLDMMKPMIEAYKKANPAVRIEMGKPLGSSGAIKALINGAIDLTVSSKPLKPEESAKGCRLKEYGKTPLVIITERNVKKSDISTEELIDIYKGKILNWPDGERLRLILRPQEDIDTKILQGLSPEMEKAVSAAKNRPGMITAVTDPEAYAMIIKTPGSIGTTSLTSIIVEKLKINALSLNKVKASIDTLKDGTYPLAKNINFVVLNETTAVVQKFLDFIYSPQGHQIALKAGVLIMAR